jgi:hypothetical protein
MEYWARSEALALYWVSELYRIEKFHDSLDKPLIME